jgi:signal peptidase I
MQTIGSRVNTRKRMDNRMKIERKSTLVFCIVVILLAVCLRLFVLGTIVVDGPSMQPTLWTGDHVMINKLTTSFGLPKRYDIIVCKFKNDSDPEKNYIKRVVALPGETVEVKNGYLLVNGQRLTDDPFGSIQRTYDSTMAKYTVPADCIFVMGDNRSDSADSVEHGPVPHKLIEGIAFFVIWPLSEVKFL